MPIAEQLFVGIVKRRCLNNAAHVFLPESGRLAKIVLLSFPESVFKIPDVDWTFDGCYSSPLTGGARTAAAAAASLLRLVGVKGKLHPSVPRLDILYNEKFFWSSGAPVLYHLICLACSFKKAAFLLCKKLRQFSRKTQIYFASVDKAIDASFQFE